MSYLSDLLNSLSGNRYTQDDVDRHAAMYDTLASNYYEGGVGNSLLDGYIPPQYAPEIPQASYSNEGRGGIGEAFAPAVKTYYGNEGRGVGVDQSQRRLADLANPANTISTPGFDPNFMRQPQPVAAATVEKPLPKNYIKNESTGKVIDLDYAVAKPTDKALDYSSPIEYMGQKGYRVKGDPFTAVMPDGSVLRMGQDVADTRARQKEDLALEKARVELEQLRAKPTSDYQKELSKRLAEADAAKLMAKTPGTVEYERAMKEQNLLKKGEASHKGAIEDASKLRGFLQQAIDQTDWNTAGLVGQVLSSIGGTDASDLESVLDSVKAKIGFAELQQMRKESPTGGALGQVAVKELEFLQSVEGSLKQKQSPAQLKKNLQAILDSTARLEADLKANPPDWTGGRPQAATTAPTTSQAAPVPIKSEAEASRLPKGTIVIINGRRAVVE